MRTLMAVERSSAMTEVGTEVQRAVDEELAAMTAEREPGRGGEHHRRSAASGSGSGRAPMRVNWVKELPSLEHSPKLKRK